MQPSKTMPETILIADAKDRWGGLMAFTGWEPVKDFYGLKEEEIENMMDSTMQETELYQVWIVNITADMAIPADTPGAFYYCNITDQFYHVYEFENGKAEVEYFRRLTRIDPFFL